MAISSETELYEPIKQFWEARGYEVKGEVRHCDVVAVRGDEQPVIIELKKSLNIPLLVQGMGRLKLSPLVYVAFELPPKGRAPHRVSWSELRTMCGMLGLGLLTVRFYKTRKKPLVEALCHPPALSAAGEYAAPPAQGAVVREPSPAYQGRGDGAAPQAPSAAVEAKLTRPRKAGVRVSKRAADRLAAEFANRHGDFNVGGSTRVKRVTAYRERALLLAWTLHEHGPLTTRKLRELSAFKEATSFMQANYYGWYERVERGVYRITAEGEAALTTFAHVVEVIRKQLPSTS
ncbi:DUF2161 family putative PD-(D/E)XK-type phosphodiesterase [Paenibacillus radicibacter]|uniref:DUF2161 family putative PD-(D/E)XK-type phosphodiesterase n=1 Tax=Paenibacillus radicibacter TaxID=2972488 RepID=UPI002159AC3D|nr:DUF2161 family putative PD-(D/E)XK-type phosphodiesterase [Paenibacillus radicibacter]